MDFTILGGQGFIGRALGEKLKKLKYSVYAPDRRELESLLCSRPDRDLGHLIYCIGVTADFRRRPLDAVQAHVCLLTRVLQAGGFSSLTYLSSTRVYAYARSTREDAWLWVQPHSLDSLYNVSKLMGESACLQSSQKTRVVRLSHVYGFEPDSENFLASVLQEAALKNKVTIRTSPDSAKDYVSLHDVTDLLPRIAVHGEYDIYNLASGVNMSNQELGHALQELGVEVDFAPGAPEWTFPRIDISRLAREFSPPQGRLASDLPGLLQMYRRQYEQEI